MEVDDPDCACTSVVSVIFVVEVDAELASDVEGALDVEPRKKSVKKLINPSDLDRFKFDFSSVDIVDMSP